LTQLPRLSPLQKRVNLSSAIVRELLAAGQQVVGLARSDTAVTALKAAGTAMHRGTIDDLDSLRSGAVASDGIIHTAFNNISETTDFAASAQADLRAVEAIGAVLEGSGKPFVITSGTILLAMLMLGRLGTEEDVSDPAMPRVASENAEITLAERGVRSSVVRLAPSVHGEGDKHGFVPSLIGIARAKGMSSLRWRRLEPLARRASARCGTPVQAGRGSRLGWFAATAQSQRARRVCRSGTSRRLSAGS